MPGQNSAYNNIDSSSHHLQDDQESISAYPGVIDDRANRVGNSDLVEIFL